MALDGQEDVGQDQYIEQDDPEGDAAFAAGFNTTRESTGDEATAGTTSSAGGQVDDGSTRDPEADAAAAAAAEAAAAAQRAADEANAPVPITRAQFEAMQAALARLPQLENQLRQTHDSMAGKVGSLQQTITSLKAQASQGKPLNVKQLKRLQAEYPDLHDMLVEDLAEAFGSTSTPGSNAGAGAPDDQQGPQQGDSKADGSTAAAEHDPLNDPQVVRTLQQQEMKIVDVIHPGWRSTTTPEGTRVPGLIDSPDFKAWRAGLPRPAQELLANTWDSNILKDAIAHFKADQASRTAQATAQAEADKQRDKRLADATPVTTGTSTGAHVVDDDAAFAAGFSKVRG